MATREELLAKARRKILLQKAREKAAGFVQQLGTTKQEQHPEISLKDRWVIKNLAQSPEASVNYLKQEYPNLEIDISDNGQLRARNPNQQWMAVDPDNTGLSYSPNMEGLKELGKDVGDIGYDAYAAATEGVAAGVGALGGGAVSLPAGATGAIPGAMLMSGLATANNEEKRQRLGRWLGIPQEVDNTDVAIAGGIGAAAPIMFGAGKARGAIPIAGEYVGKGLQKVNPFPWVGEKLSGVPRNVLRNYTDDTIQEGVQRINREGVYPYSKETFDVIDDFTDKQVQQAGDNLVQEIDQIGRPVNMKPAKASFTNAQDRILNDDVVTNADLEVQSKLQDQFSRYYGLADESGEMIPNRLDARKAWDIQKKLKQAANYEKSDLTPADVATKGVARDSYSKINKALERASKGASSEAKDQYSKALNVRNELMSEINGRTDTKAADKIYKKLSNMDRQTNRMFNEKT